MRSFVAFDFETANSQRFSICSVGMIFVEDGTIKDKVYQLINPETIFDSLNTTIHGITERDVANAPTFNTFYNDIKSELNNKLMVAHYLPFDGYALQDNIARYRIEPVPKKLLCSYQLSKILLPGLPSYTLKTLCHRYNIELKKHHNALDDSKACAELFLALLNEFQIPDEMALFEKTNIKPGKLSLGTFKTSKVKRRFSFEKIDLKSIEVNKEAESDNPFYGRKVVFTGKLNFYSRKHAAEFVANKGAFPQNGINKETDIIVLGDFDNVMIKGNKSTKLKKAEKMIEDGHQIEIISEEEFLIMVK
ncbi:MULTISPECIES: exonuclease domain-containing protein [Bacillaceae]|uniref:DNA polymerase III subunit epsilon n=1 Tax=Evansella alkalicola TaxID=745819 RepID=A0ABS6JU65_9BACI|nr:MULTISPECIES: exonuclease domain-containing protein [Bacillaceae]MBU9721960.1 DNA polymerase III subunit epsilon [Bacillus alkalicola]